VSWSQLLFWSLPLLLEPCSTLLPPLLVFPSHRASLPNWLKIHSPALSSLVSLPFDQQKIHLLMPLAPTGDQVLLLLPGKPDGPIWHSRLSGFSVLRPSCLVGGWRVRSGHLLHSSLHSQNPEQVLTIPGVSASAVEPMAHTTPPKVDTSPVEAPTVQALVARPGSKAPDDNLGDDDPNLLSFGAAESEIIF
jgi:hypothetical protein